MHLRQIPLRKLAKLVRRCFKSRIAARFFTKARLTPFQLSHHAQQGTVRTREVRFVTLNPARRRALAELRKHAQRFQAKVHKRKRKNLLRHTDKFLQRTQRRVRARRQQQHRARRVSMRSRRQQRALRRRVRFSLVTQHRAPSQNAYKLTVRQIVAQRKFFKITRGFFINNPFVAERA